MPSKKRLVKHPTKSALLASQTPGDVKKLTKPIDIYGTPQPNQSNVSISKCRKSIVIGYKSLSQPLTNYLMESAYDKTDLEKAIDEIEDIEEITEEIMEEMESDEINLIVSEDTRLLDFDIDSIEMSLSGEESDVEQPHKVESDEMLPTAFGQMPDVEEISLDWVDEEKEGKSLDKEKKTVFTIVPKIMADSGKFLQPLTGLPALDLDLSTKSISEELSSDEESDIKAEDKTEIKEPNKSLALTDDLLKEDSSKSVDDFEVARHTLHVKDHLFDLFLESTKQEELNPADVVAGDETYEHKQQQQIIEQTVTDFVNRLIDYCVSKAKSNDSDNFIKNSLDKYKLITGLKTSYDLLQLERPRLQYLEKNTVNFLKRKGCLRLITPEAPQVFILQRQNFRECLNSLDKLLATEEKTRVHNSSRIFDLKQEFNQMQNASMEKVDKLELLINTTFQRKNFDKLQSLLEKLIRKMSTARKEISRVRVEFLLQQHEYCSLNEQLEKLEDLGNGLNVRQYESLQTDTLAISKKIEEHNSNLERLHRHFRDDIHKTAHLKEKDDILNNRISAQKQFLTECMQKENQLHEQVHQLKLQRNRVKNEAKKISHQAGLLSNQVLLKDYDQTVERANKLQTTNGNLRKIIEELNAKIANFN